VGDHFVACNGASLSGARNDREAKHLCQVQAEGTLQLDVSRANHPVRLSVTAEKRPGL
jgi:hypothetical protein